MDLHRHDGAVFADIYRFKGYFALGQQVLKDLSPERGIVRGNEGPNIFALQFLALITPVSASCFVDVDKTTR